MLIVTGGAGFIGSALVWELNNRNNQDILVVDELGNSEKWKNLVNLKFLDYMEKDRLIDHLENGKIKNIEAIIHMGACSSTQETDASYLIENNYEYTKRLAKYCIDNNIRFVYASSAATYGIGDKGYSDESIDDLNPLNMYGYSKHLFDLWAQRQCVLDKMVGIKFFNVYGPNEYHKEDMRSMVNKAYCQIKAKGKIGLFKSYHPDYKDGEQKRDFVYIKDATKIVLYLLDNKDLGGIFNLGTGNAYTWNELATAIFEAMDLKPKIEYIDMPDILKGKYQYYTKADMEKVRNAGYKNKFFTLKDAVNDYIKNYLRNEKHL